MKKRKAKPASAAKVAKLVAAERDHLINENRRLSDFIKNHDAIFKGTKAQLLEAITVNQKLHKDIDRLQKLLTVKKEQVEELTYGHANELNMLKDQRSRDVMGENARIDQLIEAKRRWSLRVERMQSRLRQLAETIEKKIADHTPPTIENKQAIADYCKILAREHS